jgi:epoxyqueuosine reductase
MRRIHRAQLLRNVCVALGNVGTPAEIPALEAARDKEGPLVREHAEWAIDEIRRRS